MEDYQLLDQELRRLTADGWHIVSMSEHSAQVMQAHTVSTVGVLFLVLVPLILGVIVGLVNVMWGSSLFSLALVFAALLVLDHLSKPPKLLYITAQQLRKP